MVCLFYCFFRLPIYESIAAIFWQSASYVKNLDILIKDWTGKICPNSKVTIDADGALNIAVKSY